MRTLEGPFQVWGTDDVAQTRDNREKAVVVLLSSAIAAGGSTAGEYPGNGLEG